MFWNYLVSALRNLARNKLYAAINIVGLAVGFAAAILIALYVRDETSFERWIPGYRDVYRLVTTVHPTNGKTVQADGADQEMATWLPQEFSAITTIARLLPEPRGIRRGDIEAIESVYFADPAIFDVLPMPAVAGDLKTALQQPDSVVLTRKMARKYFGRDDVVGRTIEIDHQYPMRVTAVLEDLPSATQFHMDILASGNAAFSPLKSKGRVVITYLRLVHGASAPAIEIALPTVIDRHVPAPAPRLKASQFFVYKLEAIAAVHLLPAGAGGDIEPRGDPITLDAVSLVGLLILAVATINFVNLMTARGAKRATEVGIRKLAGGARRHLIVQFIGESLVYVATGVLVAVALTELGLPWFNAFLGREIAFAYWRDPPFAAAIAGGTLLIAVLGGLYPALVLSSFRPADVIASRLATTGGSGRLRQWLVIVQFASLIGLLVATGVMYRQTIFAAQDGFRLDTDQVLFVATPCRDAFKDRVAALPGVRASACVSRSVLGKGINVGINTLHDGTNVNFERIGMGPGSLELYGLKPLTGRFFLAGDDTRKPQALVLNETAVRLFEFASPQAAIGKSIPDQTSNEVVGVVPDFPVRSLREPMSAVVFDVPSAAADPRTNFGYLAIKLDGARAGPTLQAIDALWRRMGNARPIDRTFLDDYVQQFYVDLEREAGAFAAFAAAAIFIACLGLFGLAAFTAERRIKEIGVRKSMGATCTDILRLLTWEFAKPVLWANLIAWPIAYFAMNRWLDGFAYHIDLAPWMFFAAGAAALLIALATVAAQSLITARAKPIEALRYE